MEGSNIKVELLLEGENIVSANPEPPNSADNTQKSIDEDTAVVVKKKPKMEIELDYSLVKNEYYKPRERRAVKRYVDTLLPSETKRMQNEVENIYTIKNKTNQDDDDIYCEVCNQRFKAIKSLKTHKQSKHSNVSKFTCALCSATFDSNSELMKHKLVHKDEDRNFLCMKCKTAFSDHLDYLKHKARHEKSTNYYCIECGKEFDYRTGYNLHIETHYYRMVECEVCQHKVNANRIKEHMKVHTKNYKTKCVECGEKYGKSYMAYHMISHTGVKPHQCLYCGKGFSNYNQKRVHTRMHTGEKPFECKICHRKYRQQTDLVRHMEMHVTDTQNLSECQVCKKKFKHKESLKYHMDIHNNTQKYSCHICNYKNHTGTGLKSHIERAHSDDKKYKCIPCGVAFKTGSDINKHRKLKKHLNNQYGFEKKNREKEE